MEKFKKAVLVTRTMVEFNELGDVRILGENGSVVFNMYNPATLHCTCGQESSARQVELAVVELSNYPGGVKVTSITCEHCGTTHSNHPDTGKLIMLSRQGVTHHSFLLSEPRVFDNREEGKDIIALSIIRMVYGATKEGKVYGKSENLRISHNTKTGYTYALKGKGIRNISYVGIVPSILEIAKHATNSELDKIHVAINCFVEKVREASCPYLPSRTYDVYNAGSSNAVFQAAAIKQLQLLPAEGYGPLTNPDFRKKLKQAPMKRKGLYQAIFGMSSKHFMKYAANSVDVMLYTLLAPVMKDTNNIDKVLGLGRESNRHSETNYLSTATNWENVKPEEGMTQFNEGLMDFLLNIHGGDETLLANCIVKTEKYIQRRAFLNTYFDLGQVYLSHDGRTATGNKEPIPTEEDIEDLKKEFPLAGEHFIKKAISIREDNRALSRMLDEVPHVPQGSYGLLRYCNDIYSDYTRIMLAVEAAKEDGEELEYNLVYNNDLVELHDTLAKDANKFKERKISIPYSEEEKKVFNQSITTHTDTLGERVYEFSLPQSNHTLAEMGSDLNICVGSYANRAIEKYVIIVDVKVDGKRHACLEFNCYTDQIVQAKEARNGIPSECHANVIVEYAANVGAKIRTDDLENASLHFSPRRKFPEVAEGKVMKGSSANLGLPF